MERGPSSQRKWPGARERPALRPDISPEDPRDLARLVSELQTRQLELELQNQEACSTQEDLMRARDALQDLFDAAPVGYVNTDSEGGIVAVNLRFANFIGRAPDTFARCKLSDFIAADDQHVYYLHRRALLDKQGASEPIACQLRMRAADASMRWLALESVAVADVRGQPQLRTTISDISERKRAEDEHARLMDHLQQTHKMEAIGTLAGGVAHDVNNVLAVILMLSTSLERRLPDQDPKREDVRDIITAVMRGKKLAQDLLDFARKSPRRREICQPTEIVARVGRVLERTIPPRIAVSFQLDGSTAAVEGDPDRLMQVLMNLCMNSIDAIEGQGTITITTANVASDAPDFVDLPELPPMPYVRIEVSDDGMGMDADNQRRAFEPFFTTKDVGKGTGLGLYMVYRAVQELGGGIRLISKPHHGTTIRILLPAFRQAAKATTVMRKIEPRTAPGHRTVLVVDDEAMVRTAWARSLEDLGYAVLLAESGAQALETQRCKGREIAAILLDLSMPVMDGAECYRRLKSVDPDVPVVLCTGYPLGTAAQELVADGSAPRVLSKPCTQEELARALAEAIAQHTCTGAAC